MNYLKAEFTYNKEEENEFTEKPFIIAGFTKEQAEESIVNSKETTYSLGNKIVRFLKYEPLNQFGGFFFQYQVIELTEEDNEVPKKVFVNNKLVDAPQKEIVNMTTITIPDRVIEKEIPLPEEEPVFLQEVTRPTNILPLEEDEQVELTGQELKELLEAEGQQSLF